MFLNTLVWFHRNILVCFSCKAIEELKSSKYDIPCVIGGKEYRTAEKKEQLCVSLLLSFNII